MELDILDKITDTIQFLQGEQFKPVQQVREEELRLSDDGIMSYRITFTTRIYRQTPYPYAGRRLQIASN